MQQWGKNKMNENKESVFEIELIGFNADTDETDDKIIWIQSSSMSQVKKLINQLGIQCQSITKTDILIESTGIDFTINNY